MTKTSNSDPLSRRKLLGRIGVLAAAGYAVPAFTTLSMAQAGSGASGGGNDSSSNSSNSSNASAASEPSAASAPSNSSGPSGGNDDGGTTDGKVKNCGTENLNDPAYVQCLADNGY